jgi:hypothetical protein
MYESPYDRILAANLREFEINIKATVARLFVRWREAIRAGEEVEIPAIGGALPPLEYRTAEYFDELQATVVRALIARKWFESEAGLWAQPLPLTTDDITALLNIREVRQHGRSSLRSNYGQHLRTLRWHIEHATPFEMFCAEKYNTGSEPTYGVRKKRGRPKGSRKYGAGLLLL